MKGACNERLVLDEDVIDIGCQGGRKWWKSVQEIAEPCGDVKSKEKQRGNAMGTTTTKLPNNSNSNRIQLPF